MLSILVGLFIAALSFYYYNYVWIYPANFPAGPRFPLPIIGDVWSLSKKLSPLQIIEEMHRKYGPIVGFAMGSKLCVSLSDYDVVAKYFSKAEFSQRDSSVSQIYMRGGSVFGGQVPGLVFSNGEHFRHIRKFSLR